MYYVFNGRNWINFENYEFLINWLSQHNMRCGSVVENQFLEKVGNSENDCYLAKIHYQSTFAIYGVSIIREYMPREYRILNEDYVSIYDELLVKDVKNWVYSDDVFKRWLATKRHNSYRVHNGRLYLGDKQFPEFRNGPWPYVRCRRGGGGWYRRIKTTNERRQSADPEYKQFNRGSRGKNLPSAWDDVGRDWRDDGWKSQGKNRHQWEHGVKTKAKHKHGKGLYVSKVNIKRAWDWNLDDIDDNIA